MTTKTINITAISPFIVYSGGWQTNAGATVNGNINVSPPPSRHLVAASGTLTVNGFMNAINVRGSQSGVGCSYTARIQSQNDSITLPPAQTSPRDAYLLVSFSGLPFGSYSLSIDAKCSAPALLEVTQVEMSLWCGDSGQIVTEEDADDTSPLLNYSINDWTANRHLDAAFFNDTQHYARTNGATVSMTLSGVSIVIFYGSLDPNRGEFRVNTSSPSTPPTSDTYNGLSSFLAVPVPLFITSGLDPRVEHTITLEKTSAAYLDLDYVEIYKVDTYNPGEPRTPTGGGLQPKSNNLNLVVLIAEIVGPVLGFLILAALFCFCIRRRRRGPVRRSWLSGAEKPHRNVFGRISDNSVQPTKGLYPRSSPPMSPGTEFSRAYIPTPYTLSGSTSSPSTTGSMFHPLSERPLSVAHPVVHRPNKMAEMDHARRLALVGSVVSSSSASASDPYEALVPLTPDLATPPRSSIAPDSLISPVVATSINTSASTTQPHHDDSHPISLPNSPPPRYDVLK